MPTALPTSAGTYSHTHWHPWLCNLLPTHCLSLAFPQVFTFQWLPVLDRDLHKLHVYYPHLILVLSCTHMTLASWHLHTHAYCPSFVFCSLMHSQHTVAIWLLQDPQWYANCSILLSADSWTQTHSALHWHLQALTLTYSPNPSCSAGNCIHRHTASLDSAGHCTHMLSDTLWPLQVHTPMLPLHLCSFSMNMNSQAHCLVWTLLACLWYGNPVLCRNLHLNVNWNLAFSRHWVTHGNQSILASAGTWTTWPMPLHLPSLPCQLHLSRTPYTPFIYTVTTWLLYESEQTCLLPTSGHGPSLCSQGHCPHGVC